MSYADYDYYKNSYGGSLITEDKFSFTAARASDIIDEATFSRLENSVPEEFSEKVRVCCCELAESIYSYTVRTGDSESSGGASSGIASEKIGQYSVTYQSESEEQAKKLSLAIGSDGNLDKLYYGIILKHLGNTGLMFRGVD